MKWLRSFTPFAQIADLYRSMMDVLEQDWNGAKHLGKAVTDEQVKQWVQLVLQAKELEYQTVRIVKESLPR